MGMTIFRGVVAGLIVIGVTELSAKSPRFGALLLSLPLVSIIAFTMTWLKFGDIGVISPLARETLILVPLGLPFFVPLAFSQRLGFSFWSAFVAGIVLATICIAAWFRFAPTFGK